MVLVQGLEALETIAGRPLLTLWMERLADAAVADVRIVADARLAEPLAAFAASWANRSGMHLVINAGEPATSEPAAIAANRDLAEIADTVVVIPGGAFSDVNLARMLAFHHQHPHDVTAALYHEALGDPATFVELDTRKQVVTFTNERIPSGLAITGVYAISSRRFREIADAAATKPDATILEICRGGTRGWPWVWYHRDVASADVLEQVRHEAPAILEDMSRKGRPAVFLDRDGTLIEEVNYLSDPDQVRVLPGVAEALRQLRVAGFARVVVTNQSAVGRGMITLDRLHEIHEAMHDRLYEQRAAVDAVYFCPDAPRDDGTPEDPNGRRKPGAGMLIAAAADLGLDLEASWMVGDQIGDLIAGQRAGCRGSILVQTGQGLANHDASHVPHEVAPDLLAACEIILAGGSRETVAVGQPVPA